MIASILLVVLGSTVFVEQEIPDLRFSKFQIRLSVVESADYKHVDLDGDGYNEIILPDEVYFCKDGEYPEGGRIKIPYIEERPRCDLWDTQFYLCFKDRLRVIKWDNDAWQELINHPITWPDNFSEPRTEDDVSGLWFVEFLHDFDADGVPEIVIPSEKGIHIYALEGDVYTEINCLDVFSGLIEWTGSHQDLYPAWKRHFESPERVLSCSTWFVGNKINVARDDYLPDRTKRYGVVTYTLDSDNEFSVIPDKTTKRFSEPVKWVFACRLNNDEILDFAGFDFELSSSSVLPVPIMEIKVSTDGGFSFETKRSRTVLLHYPLVDFDGDGDKDIVMEELGMLKGGPREIVTKYLTKKTIQHELRVYLQDENGNFSKSADISGRFKIKLDKMLHRQGLMGERYVSRELIDYTGDIDGDGNCDVVVQDRLDRLSIYLNKGKSFSKKADISLEFDPDWRFDVTDVDGDGRSDILVRSRNKKEPGETDKSTVLFSREAVK